MHVEHLPNGRTIVDTAAMAALARRPPAAIRQHCTRSTAGYDADACTVQLDGAPDPILLTAAQAWQYLGIRAGTIRSRASRRQLRALDRNEHGHPLYALTDLDQLPKG